MAKITTTKTHTSGIALGGIGGGSVELLPDGEFHCWLVANQPRLTEVCFEKRLMMKRLQSLTEFPSLHRVQFILTLLSQALVASL